MEVQELIPRAIPFSNVSINRTARVEMITVIIAVIIIIFISRTILARFALEYLTWQSPWDCFSLFLIIYPLFELKPRVGLFVQVPRRR